ncbi:MAG: hypothetical protein M3R45_17205, partial [Pseudomonadota bacterium]|nr:hypothetical protein [Pseudomonadota bacterium]
MSSNPDKSDSWAHYARIGASASVGALAILLLAACSTRPASPAGPRAPAQGALPSAPPASAPA